MTFQEIISENQAKLYGLNNQIDSVPHNNEVLIFIFEGYSIEQNFVTVQSGPVNKQKDLFFVQEMDCT